MKLSLKLGALTRAEDVALVPSGGVAGFLIGAASSPRNLTKEAAAALIEHVPKEAEAWAVVVSPSADDVHALFDEVGVDRVQVYGATPDGLEFLEIHHLVPSLPVPPVGVEGESPKVPPAEDYPRLHLDAAGDPIATGSALVPNWEICAQIVDAQPGRKFTLAGGLTAENVAEALGIVHPWGLDVTVGVEQNAGVLDPARLHAFVAAIEAFETGGA
ncbi:MAG: phosphoribosylanthranilate isomerase [Thermoplasmata archaeon]|nr:phosphoribosylanthranilate isomerase [Thermoplasmata archaeon]MCI4344160.1 phosphoribosylanthranilate isomerase [Thermoplasmata archaeon]